MKQYYIETPWGDSLLKAKTLEEAKDEVRWDYANGGKKKITCVVFKMVDKKEHIIDTDWTK